MFIFWWQDATELWRDLVIDMLFKNKKTIITLMLATLLLSLPVAAKFERFELESYPDAKNNLSRKTSANFLDKLRTADSARVIVLYSEVSAPEVMSSAEAIRSAQAASSTQAQPLSPYHLRLNRLRDLKQRANNKLTSGEYHIVHAYDQFPMQALQLKTTASLAQLLSDPDVIAVYNDEPLELHLTQSLPLIHEETAINQGVAGQGVSIAVLDSGVNYANAAFGSCTSPGMPAACHVSAAVDIALNDGVLDSNGHGTHVAAIALGVAPAANIIALDIMSGTTISSSDAIAGINWVVANRVTYNIVALNMSFGSSTTYTLQCASFNPFFIPVSNAKAAGISVIASSGNNANANAIASPACTPGALAIGAVYDANVGGLNWSVCTDNTTNIDQVGCFSNSASYLFLLAPGAMITAAGATLAGTSQAAPHVAGAMALLKSAYPDLSLAELEIALRKSATLITDARNNNTTPRLDLQAAIGMVAVAYTGQIPLLPPWGEILLLLGLVGVFLINPVKNIK